MGKRDEIMRGVCGLSVGWLARGVNEQIWGGVCTHSYYLRKAQVTRWIEPLNERCGAVRGLEWGGRFVVWVACQGRVNISYLSFIFLPHLFNFIVLVQKYYRERSIVTVKKIKFENILKISVLGFSELKNIFIQNVCRPTYI